MTRVVGFLALAIACGDNTRLGPDASTSPPGDSGPPDSASPDAAPDTAITLSPALHARSAAATFAFAGSTSADHFECALDGDAFARCATPLELTVSDGAHTFAVRAVDAGGNRDVSPASFTWTVDTVAPDTAITLTPSALATSAAASFTFAGSDGDDRFECTLDGGAFAPCSPPLDLTVGDGVHVFAARAVDLAGNADASPATFRWTVDTQPAVCGDGAAHGNEPCDGGDLRSATCASLGHAPGTLACTADCLKYDTSGCVGSYAPANAGFTGTVCFNGLKYSTPNLSTPYLLACTEEAGVFKAPSGTSLAWSSVNTGITNLHGRGIATNPSGPPVYYIADTSAPSNGFRSSTYAASWTAHSISDGTALRDLFAFSFRSPLQNLAGSWDPALGAVVLHGNAPALVPHFVGPAPGTITGTPRGFASGGASDVYVAVYGETPAGVPTRGGIFRACDLTPSTGGTYEERDAGLPPDDLGRVWSLTVDPASITSASFPCGTATTSGYATTYYAALRGGGQIYKTSDGGLTWRQSNSGITPGAEVYEIAIDCFSTTTAALCQDHQLLYAATSAGLYRSSDAGASWALDGFESRVVRAVTIDPQPTTSPPRVVVGVQDAVGIYVHTP